MFKETLITMRCLIIAILIIFLIIPSVSLADRVRLTGSGASFPFPIYSTWFKNYGRANRDVIIDYQAKGSGAGIKDFINGTVDFAASDAAMSDKEIAQVEAGVILLPMTAGEVVLAYNIRKNPKGLKLPREVYPKIFLGEITKWNDPALVEANPDLKLPDLDITVVRRADSSGTTYVFTKHLSTISEDWKGGPGTGKTVKWPDSDKIIASPKNDGVTATIKQTPGAIGYIEYGYAKLAKLNMASLENQAEQYIEPGLEGGMATLASVELPENDMRVWLSDPEGKDAYPIATYTWMLFYATYEDEAKSEALKKVIEYCLTEGQKIADKLGYIPLPESVVAKVMEEAQKIKP